MPGQAFHHQSLIGGWTPANALHYLDGQVDNLGLGMLARPVGTTGSEQSLNGPMSVRGAVPIDRHSSWRLRLGSQKSTACHGSRGLSGMAAGHASSKFKRLLPPGFLALGHHNVPDKTARSQDHKVKVWLPKVDLFTFVMLCKQVSARSKVNCDQFFPWWLLVHKRCVYRSHLSPCLLAWRRTSSTFQRLINTVLSGCADSS